MESQGFAISIWTVTTPQEALLARRKLKANESDVMSKKVACFCWGKMGLGK